VVGRNVGGLGRSCSLTSDLSASSGHDYPNQYPKKAGAAFWLLGRRKDPGAVMCLDLGRSRDCHDDDHATSGFHSADGFPACQLHSGTIAGPPSQQFCSCQFGSRICLHDCAGKRNNSPLCAGRDWSGGHSAARLPRRLQLVKMFAWGTLLLNCPLFLAKERK